MTTRTTALALAAVLLPLFAAAQSDSPPPGSVISLPNPDLPAIQLERYEIPELAGAKPVTGSFLIDGRLPRPLIDYGAKAPGIIQSVTIFEQGLIAVRIDSGTARIRKRLILPKDAFASYIARVSPARIKDAVLPDFHEQMTYEYLRAYENDGTMIERRFDPAFVLPGELEMPRAMMQDIIRAIGHDREVTNSLMGYVPRVGDHLVREDQRLFEVTRIIDKTFVELKCESEPTSMYVAIGDIQQLFVGLQKAPPRPNE